MTRLARIALGACAALLFSTAATAEISLNSFRVGAKDVVALAKFYQAAFGLQEVSRLDTASGPELFLNFGDTVDAAKANKGLRVVLMHSDSDAIKDPVPHLIFTVTDAVATTKAVKAAGGTMSSEPKPYGNTGVVIAIAIDPAGNLVELIQRRP